MNKTPHRLLHDALTAEQYEKLLANVRGGYWDAYGFFSAKKASNAINKAFNWRLSNEGYASWRAIYDSLKERGL